MSATVTDEGDLEEKLLDLIFNRARLGLPLFRK